MTKSEEKQLNEQGIKMARLEEKTDNIEKKVDILLTKFDGLDQKFAPKWVERFVYYLITLLTAGLIGGAIATLFK